jgi:hypothetical protein
MTWTDRAGSSLARILDTVSFSKRCLSSGSEAGLGKSTPVRMKVFSALRAMKFDITIIQAVYGRT